MERRVLYKEPERVIASPPLSPDPLPQLPLSLNRQALTRERASSPSPPPAPPHSTPPRGSCGSRHSWWLEAQSAEVWVRMD